MRVRGANSCKPRGTQATSRREASPTSSCSHFKQFAAGSFPLDYYNGLVSLAIIGFHQIYPSQYRHRYRLQKNA